MAILDASIAQALNALLEDERASVELEIAFANGATEPNERESFVAMGGADIELCCALRDAIVASGAESTDRINGVVLRILSLDAYDERLRAFAVHLRRTRDAVERLLDEPLDSRLRSSLEEQCLAQLRNAEWSERRADAFARSRLLDFRTDRADGAELELAGHQERDTHARPEATIEQPTHGDDANGAEPGKAGRARQEELPLNGRGLVDSEFE